MDTKYIIEKEDYFHENTLHHLHRCNQSYLSHELLSTAVTASVFVESLLKDILSELLQKDFINKELYDLIGIFSSNISKRAIPESPIFSPKPDSVFYTNLINYADQIRMKRNLLVHDVGMKNTALQADVLDMINNLERIIDCYIQTALAADIQRKKRKNRTTAEVSEEPVPADFSVFVSTITPHTVEQEIFLNAFRKKLRDLGIEPIDGNPQTTDAHENPMESARDRMKPCDAVIILGLERSHAYFVRDKEGSEKMTEATHRRYTSSWLHMEAGYAIALNKILYVVRQEDLFADGIFDDLENSYHRKILSLPLSIDDPKLNMLFKELQELKEKKEQRNKKKRTTAKKPKKTDSDAWGLE